MKQIIISILCLTFFLTGCATVGKEMHQADVNKIQKGITTKDQIIGIFGQPDTTYFDADGNLVFSYFASKFSPSVYSFIPLVNVVHNEYKMNNQMLIIIFDKNDTVRTYSFTNPNKTVGMGIVP